MKKNKKASTILLIFLLIIICIGVSVWYYFKNKASELTMPDNTPNYTEMLKTYYENLNQSWNNEVTVESLSEQTNSVLLKVSCPSTEACVTVPNTIGYIEEDKYTFTIMATINEEAITELNIPLISQTETLLQSIYEKLGTSVNKEAISNATIVENTYYGIIDNLPSYLVKISYSCTDQTANCIYTVPVENDGTNFIATYLVEFSLNEENEMQVANVLSSLDATTKILKYNENPNDSRAYEREILKNYLVEKSLITAEANLTFPVNEPGILITCPDNTTACTNISTEVLEIRENGYYLNCSYDFAATPFNNPYISYLEF